MKEVLYVAATNTNFWCATDFKKKSVTKRINIPYSLSLIFAEEKYQVGVHKWRWEPYQMAFIFGIVHLKVVFISLHKRLERLEELVLNSIFVQFECDINIGYYASKFKICKKGNSINRSFTITCYSIFCVYSEHWIVEI